MKIIFGSACVAVSWMLGYALVAVLGEGLTAVMAYSLITGWWLSAFVSSKLRLKTSAAVPLMVAFLFVFLVFTLQGQGWFYRDASSASTQRIILVGVLQSLVIGSPIIFNRVVDLVIEIIRKRGISNWRKAT